MRIGFYMCIVLVPCFVVLSLVFGMLKEKSARLVSGFNTLPRHEQEKYDKKRMAKDCRNQFALWSVIMLAGAVGSWFLSGLFAAGAYIIWLVLFFKEVHLDAEKAFAKYKIRG